MDFIQECERQHFHTGNAVKSGDANVLSTFYSLRPILNNHAALQINRWSTLLDFQLLRGDGCSVRVRQLFPESALVCSISESPRPWGRVHADKELSPAVISHGPLPMNAALPPDGSSAALNSATSESLSADFDSIWTSVSVWKGGSTVKRITQNSPMRCSVTACQFFSSIHPSIVPSFARSSFHLPVCAYLCLFLPLLGQYCSSFECFPHPSPFAL